MFTQALEGRKRVLSPSYIATLDTVNNLGLLYTKQGKLANTNKMYRQALLGFEDTLGLESISRYMPTLDII
jgi:Tfp pilus assembly protein PilF